MRFARTFVLAFLSLALTVFLAQPARPGGQTATPAAQSSPQAVTLLQQSLAALTGGKSITDITLSGTARRIAGSDDETGTCVFKAIAGAARMDLSLSSGSRSEVANLTVAPAVGSWSGPDGIPQNVASHNLWNEPAWFSPAIAVTRSLSTSGYVATYVGHETRDSVPVEHLSLFQQVAGTANAVAHIQHFSQTNLFLDSSTLLPMAMTLSVHPDNNALLDIPVEIRFSDYRFTNGAQIPFHVQKFFNNSLLLDLQFQSATINSGISAANFQVQ